ncbi:MAG: AAA-like domain-containing protein [Leptolyngbya sp. SIO1E4]|nr:AAA-like domain-containing protein [Leptolyngbya sp. SIO1E4]
MANYYQIGGSLDYKAPTYIERQADRDLYTALLGGEFCYVFNSRQMGKSSLMVRSWHRLQAEGHRCAVVDVTNIGSDHITPEQWYRGMMSTLALQFNLHTRDIRSWWQAHSHLSLTQILSQFIEMLLAQCSEQRLFIFVDEVDSLLNLPFSVDDFFALIRFCYNRRTIEPDYKRLTFAIFGVATPADLIADKQRTPFNIGRAIVLNGFSLEDAMPLAQGLDLQTPNTQAILQEVLNWTGGQPFLTQKVCQLLVSFSQTAVNEPLKVPPGMEKFWVDSVVRSHIIDRWESQDEPEHLRTIRDRLLYDERRTGRLLGIYQRWLEGQVISADDSRDQIELLLSGVMVQQAGQLRSKNQIYEKVFDLAWVQRQLNALRPYAEAFDAWVASQQTDESRLLWGQALHDAQDWAQGKSLSDLDYRFLSLGQEQEQTEVQKTLDLEKAEAAKRTTRLQRILLGITSGALVIVSLLGLTAFRQYRRAISSEQNARLSEQTSRLNEIRALISSAEGQFDSHHELEALIDAIKAKRRLQDLETTEPDLETAANSVLSQIVYWITERNRLSGHQSGILGIAYSPDGTVIATTSADQTIKLWAQNGKLLHTLSHSASPYGVAFHPLHPLLAVTTLTGELTLWNLEDNTLMHVVQAHVGPVWDIAFAPKADFLVTGGSNQQVKLWSLDGTLNKTLSGHQDIVIQVAVNPADQTIASASHDRTVKIWTPDGQLLRALPATQNVWTVAFSSTSDLLALSGDDADIQLWRTNKEHHLTLEGHTKRVERLAFIPDMNAIASTGLDHTVRIWGQDGLTWRVVPVAEDARNLALSPNQPHTMVTSGFKKVAQIRQWENPLLKTVFLNDEPFDIAVSPDGNRLISGDNSTLHIWDSERRIVGTLEKGQARLQGFDFSSDGQMLAAVGADGTVQLWTPDGRFLRDLEGLEFIAFDAAFSPDSQQIAVTAEDGTISIWTVEGDLIHTLHSHEGRGHRVIFSPDGQKLISSGTDGTVQIWQADGTHLRSIDAHKGVIFGLSVSPDGKFFASAGSDQITKLWRWDGTLVRTFEGHTNHIYGVDFSLDGQMLATASDDQTIILWSLDGEKIKTLYSHGRGFKSVKFSPSGELVTAAEDGTITLWNLEEILVMNELEYACNWIADYLENNAEVTEDDRTLCEGITTNPF